jgi:branched-chain amino acid transport system ATP-binding protein
MARVVSADAPVLLRAERIGKKFGGFAALDAVDVEVRAGERVGLIGPNGSGKSTFVNCLAGDLAIHDGTVRFDGAVLDGLAPHARTWRGLARTFQLPRPFRGLSVLDNVRVPLLFARGGGRMRASAIERRARECLDLVELAAASHSDTRNLTQVDLRKLELARAIAAAPRLLIADEAMAGLSHAEIDQILDVLMRLNASGTAIVMIEHIMRAVTAFSQRLIVFVAGRKIADGPPGAVLAMAEVERAYLGQ